MIATTGFAAIIFTKDMKLAVGGVAITEIHKFALTALCACTSLAPDPSSFPYAHLTTVSLFTLYWTESFEPLLVSIAIAGVCTHPERFSFFHGDTERWLTLSQTITPPVILVHAAGKKTGFLTKAKATLESVKSDVKSKIDASKNN